MSVNRSLIFVKNAEIYISTEFVHNIQNLSEGFCLCRYFFLFGNRFSVLAAAYTDKQKEGVYVKPVALKFLCVFTAVLFAASMFASCKKKDGYANSGKNGSAEFRQEEGELFSDVPTGSYKGYSFNILNARVGSEATAMVAGELEEGDSLNEALARRNMNVEERLDIEISEVRDTPKAVYEKTAAAVLAGDKTYDAVWNSASYMSGLAVSGYLVAGDSIPGLDFSKPWWLADATDAACADTGRYLMFGDLQMSYFDGHSMVAVNMSAVRDNDSLPDPYTLVDNGAWTVDKMLEMMSSASYDADGNGIATWEDMYGTAVVGGEMLPLMYGAGQRCSRTDGMGLPYVDIFDSDPFYTAFSKLSEKLYSGSSYVYDAKHSSDGISPTGMFKSGHALFLIGTLGDLEGLRDMESEIAVLPIPKGSAAQKEYISFVSGTAAALGVPTSAQNLSRTGTVLENLCAESYRSDGLWERYAGETLAFKYVDDERSGENIKRILASGTVDPAEIFDWGGINEALADLTWNCTAYSSTLAALRDSAQNDTLDSLEKLLDNG